jgi:hypothetical protein
MSAPPREGKQVFTGLAQTPVLGVYDFAAIMPRHRGALREIADAKNRPSAPVRQCILLSADAAPIFSPVGGNAVATPPLPSSSNVIPRRLSTPPHVAWWLGDKTAK